MPRALPRPSRTPPASAGPSRAALRLAPCRRQGRGDRAARGGLHANLRARGRGAHRRAAPCSMRPHGAPRRTAHVTRRATSWSPPAARPFVPDASRAPSSRSPRTRCSSSSACRSRILIAGGGYIAVEFAGIFAGLGVEVDAGACAATSAARLRRGHAQRPHGASMPEAGIRIVAERRDRQHRRARRRHRRQPHRTATAIACRAGAVRHGPHPQHGRPRARARRASSLDAAGAIGVDALLADRVPSHLRRRRRHRPGEPDPGRHPRGARLRRHRLWRQADRGRPLAVPTAVFTTPEIGSVGLTEARGAQPLRR